MPLFLRHPANVCGNKYPNQLNTLQFCTYFYALSTIKRRIKTLYQIAMKYPLGLKLLAGLALLAISNSLFAQVTTQPSPAIESQSVKITFDATQGSAGLKEYTGDVYAHIGVITNLSTSGGDWKYVKAGWSENKPECKMTRTSTNTYTLDLNPSIRSYFGVPASEQIKQIALVFRSADGTKTGKATGDKDIYVDVFTNSIALKVNSPADGSTFLVGENIAVNATATATTIDLFIDNNKVTSSTTSPLTYTFTPTSAKQYILKVVAKDASNLTEEKTVTVNVVSPPITEALPNGARPGLNINGGKATFVLEAPGKKFCSLIGSFNNYTVDQNFAMKITPDGKKFWITIDTLRNNVDYSYQYLVNGKVKVADPYSTTILDPWNDKYIDASTYPKMPSYPVGLTSGVVSSFRMNPTPYVWQKTDFTPAAPSKMNIYEVHLRDFLAKHDFKTLADTISYFKKLGVNTIELMPINEFEGNNSWGYNPSFYFAVDKYYGPANDLKKFVDKCHKEGIAVVIDMVLNHSYGLSPLVQLYFDSATNKVAANNPWYNVDSPNTAYAWGYDFNHESQYTKNFVDSVGAYWMQEFKIDGFRFDFTKGFTQTSGDGWAYDASRIAILKRMNSEIKKRNPNAIVILEHLAINTEEKELANEGILLWGNMNNPSCEAAMGYNENNKSDLTFAAYKNRGWSKPSLVSYMESHDEERVTFKQLAYGASNGSYSVKDLKTAAQHHAALAAVFLSIPGPKMVWQWQELGYDYSINTCENGTINNDCRTSPKPSFWNRNNSNAENAPRMELKSAIAQLFELRNRYTAFSTSNYETNLTGAVKHVRLKDGEMNVITVANFGLTDAPFEIAVAETGYYYSQLSKDSIAVTNGKISRTLKPGEYHVLTSKRLFTPLKLAITSPTEASTFTVGDMVNIASTSAASKTTLYINNTKIGDFGSNISYSYSIAEVGTYTIKVVATEGENVESKTVTITGVDKPVDLTLTSPKEGDRFFLGQPITVNAAANSNAITLYVDDKAVASGTNSISYTFTPTKAGAVKIWVMASNTAESKSITISVPVVTSSSFGPNPAKKGDLIRFYLEPTVDGKVNIDIYSLNGTKVLSDVKDVKNSTSIISIDTAQRGLGRAGIYLVRITGSGVDVKEKLIIL